MIETRLSTLAVNAEADALAALLSGGFFDLLMGPKGENPDEVAPIEQRLARLPFAEVAFAKSVNGVLRANPLGKSVATRTGDPTWYQCLTKEGVPVLDGTAGQAGANATTKSKTIQEGSIVEITNFRHVVSRQAGVL